MPGSYVLHRPTDATAPVSGFACPSGTRDEECRHGRDHRYAAGSGGVKDLALLRFELGIGEHAGIPELAKLFELGKLVVGARGGGRLSVLRLGVLRLRCGGWGLLGVGGLLFLFLASPPPLLAVVDASGYAGSGSRDNCGAGDPANETWHGISLS
jgi:hypothetical protein